MRVFAALLTLICLHLGGLCAQAAEPAPKAAFTGYDAITGDVATTSVRHFVREKGLALISFLGQHVDARLKEHHAGALHGAGPVFASEPMPDHDPARIDRPAFVESLLSLDTAFALGGGDLRDRGREPVRATLSAGPSRVRLMLRMSW